MREFIKAWHRQKPVRIDNRDNFYDYTDGLEFAMLHDDAVEICKILSMDIPKIYIIGNMGDLYNGCRDGYIKYSNKPSIFIYYNENSIAYTLAYELYHAYQYKTYKQRFKNGKLHTEYKAQTETEAKAFAHAYCKKYAHYLFEKQVISKYLYEEKNLKYLNEQGMVITVNDLVKKFDVMLPEK